jgi:hypothetical protein
MRKFELRLESFASLASRVLVSGFSRMLKVAVRVFAMNTEIRDYVAKDKPDAAARLATRIVSLVEALKEYPYLGRIGTGPGVRELIVGGTPYSIFFRVAVEPSYDCDDLARSAIKTATTKLTLTSP